jgi:hypothetical protein
VEGKFNLFTCINNGNREIVKLNGIELNLIHCKETKTKHFILKKLVQYQSENESMQTILGVGV